MKIWKKHRKILNPAFGISTVQSFVPIFNEVSAEFSNQLMHHLDDGKEFDLFQYSVNATLDSICRKMFEPFLIKIFWYLMRISSCRDFVWSQR